MKIQGKILWYNERDGYGQINGNDGIRYYVDNSVLSFEPTKFGHDLVEFQLNTLISNPPCAMNVTLKERIN